MDVWVCQKPMTGTNGIRSSTIAAVQSGCGLANGSREGTGDASGSIDGEGAGLASGSAEGSRTGRAGASAVRVSVGIAAASVMEPVTAPAGAMAPGSVGAAGARPVSPLAAGTAESAGAGDAVAAGTTDAGAAETLGAGEGSLSREFSADTMNAADASTNRPTRKTTSSLEKVGPPVTPPPDPRDANVGRVGGTPEVWGCGS